MKIVPSPRSSYVRVKPVGTPPDSFFDFSAFTTHTPTKGSLRTGGVVVGRGAGAGAFGAGFGLVCANATVLQQSTKPAMSRRKVKRGSRMLKCPTLRASQVFSSGHQKLNATDNTTTGSLSSGLKT